MSHNIDLNSMCRLCLKCDKEQHELINILENDENCSLPLRIMACLSLEVNKKDALPKNMCIECRLDLEKFYFFQKKSKSTDSKLRRHFRLINAGKISHTLTQEDEEDFEESLALLAKWGSLIKNKQELMEKQCESLKSQWDSDKRRWELERAKLQKENKLLEKLRLEKEQELEKLLNQNFNSIEIENVSGEINVKNEPNDSHKNKEQSNVRTVTEENEYSGTLFVLEGTSNNSDEYEMLTDDPNYYSSMFDEAETENCTDIVERDQSTYILSENDDQIEVSFADDNDDENVKVDDEDYTNAEYLEFDDCYEEEAVEEEIIPLEYNAISKVIRNTIASCSGITGDQEGIECKLYKKNGKATKIAVKTNAEPDKVFYLAIQENSDDSETGKRKPYRCSICSKTFDSNGELSRHAKNIHEKKQGQSCDYCSKWFPSKSSLDRHYRIHTGEKPFRCEECGKAFVQKEILKRHLMIHSGEKPHMCSFCDKGFVQRDMLRQHINRKHSANPVINLHKCHLCSKSFYHASGLSRHLSVHTGRKFECEYCSKSFSDKSAMKRHVVSLHTNIVKIES